MIEGFTIGKEILALNLLNTSGISTGKSAPIMGSLSSCCMIKPKRSFLRGRSFERVAKVLARATAWCASFRGPRCDMRLVDQGFSLLAQYFRLRVGAFLLSKEEAGAPEKRTDDDECGEGG